MPRTVSPRTAYVLTKVVVFALAALLTWPLSRVIGPRAWWGLAAFGVILVALTFVVFFAFGRRQTVAGRSHVDGDADVDADDGGDPDEPVELPVEDFIDLHLFAPRDIPDVVREYVSAAHAAGFREVRLIHGKGIGVQRERTRRVLSEHPLVTSFSDGTADRGTWGATIARLTDGS
jgi:hypothetical protein